MVLQELLTQEEIDLLYSALEAQGNRAKAIANRPLQGYGDSYEKEKKKEWLKKSDKYFDLMSKLNELTL